MRKADTQMQLIDILLDEKKEAPQETYGWFDMMLAHSAVSLLTSVACVDFRLSVDYYKRLKGKGIFPLTTNRASTKNTRKIKMLNLCPRLLLILVHFHNR